MRRRGNGIEMKKERDTVTERQMKRREENESERRGKKSS